MKIVLLTALLGLSVWAADAAMIVFDGSETRPGNNAFGNLSLPQFNPALGTLTGVQITVLQTTLGGSFSVTAVSGSDVTVNSAAARITIQGLDLDLGYTTLGETSFGVSTDPSLPLVVPGNSSSGSINVNSQDVFVNESQAISSTFWGAYQGTGSVTFQVRNNPNVTVSGGDFSVTSSTFTANTTMQVTYNYTPFGDPSGAIPEPGSMAMLMIGSAAILGLRRRRIMP